MSAKFSSASILYRKGLSQTSFTFFSAWKRQNRQEGTLLPVVVLVVGPVRGLGLRRARTSDGVDGAADGGLAPAPLVGGGAIGGFTSEA